MRNGTIEGMREKNDRTKLWDRFSKKPTTRDLFEMVIQLSEDVRGSNARMDAMLIPEQAERDDGYHFGLNFLMKHPQGVDAATRKQREAFFTAELLDFMKKHRVMKIDVAILKTP